MKLTAKQEAFCVAYFETGNAAQAYAAAYDAHGMKAATVYSKASILLKDGKIRARMAELGASIRERAEISAEERIARYSHLAVMAEVTGDFSTAIRAEDSITKIVGLFAAERKNEQPPLMGALEELTKRHRAKHNGHSTH